MERVLVRPRVVPIERAFIFVVMCAFAMMLATRLVIPFSPVPVTAQVFVVVLSGLWMGMGAAVAQCVFWVMVTSFGVMTASGVTGPGALFGPTGGYLIAFPIAALLIGYISETSKSMPRMALASLAGLALIYLLGSVWLAFFVHSFGRAVALGVLPFCRIDLIKCALAVVIAHRSRDHVHRWLEGGNSIQ